MTMFNGDFSFVPHFDQWIGLWAMEPGAMNALASLIQQTDIAQHVQIQQEAMQAAGRSSGWWYRQDDDGVAVMNLGGTLQKHRQSMSRATSTVITRQEIRAALNDDKIKSILLSIDSPGGTAAGTKELADEIARASLAKPVFAHITDLGASAAYWIASAAPTISANEAANVGSIGTYGIVQDLSALAAKEGVKVHVVRAGHYKGMGAPGTEITAEQLAEIQRMVDAHNDLFLQGVATGRNINIEQVRQLADGRVHPAAQAKSLGLIDKVQTYEDALEQAKQVGGPKSSASKTSQKEKTRMTATSKEIKAACPGASADFVVACMDADKDIAQAQSAWMQELATDNAAMKEQIETLSKENTELKASLAESEEKVKKVAKGGAGVEPLEESTSKTQSNSSYWDKVKELKQQGKSRAEAMSFVNKNHPDLRAEMLAEVNS